MSVLAVILKSSVFELLMPESSAVAVTGVFIRLNCETMLFHVIGPTTPSTDNPNWFWNCRTAFSVIGPNEPSTFTRGMLGNFTPMVFSIRCIADTLSPREPLRNGVPGYDGFDTVGRLLRTDTMRAHVIGPDGVK